MQHLINPPCQHCLILFYDRMMDFTTLAGNNLSEHRVFNDTAERTVDMKTASEKIPASIAESHFFHTRGTSLFSSLTNQKRRDLYLLIFQE